MKNFLSLLLGFLIGGALIPSEAFAQQGSVKQVKLTSFTLQSSSLIPDDSDEFNKEYNLEQFSYLPNDPNPWKKLYWYRTSFTVPEGWAASWPDNLPGGVYSGGPYPWRDPKDYYRRAIAGRDWVFKDETGIPSMPPYNILPKIIPDLVWDKTLPFPLNHTWGYHDAATGRFALHGGISQAESLRLEREGESGNTRDGLIKPTGEQRCLQPL